jgi:alpha-beta hydrolase superfamily lysophospholipase
MKLSEFSMEAEGLAPWFARAWMPEQTPWAMVGLVHGLGDHSGRYAGVAQALVGAGIGVVGYDQRGHGLTGGPLPTFEVLLSDIDRMIAAMEALNDAPKFLYGASLGGGLVLNYALHCQSQYVSHSRHQKSRLQGAIASSPLLTPAFKPPAWKLMLARWLRNLWPSFTLASGIDPNDLSRDPLAVEQYRNDPQVHHRISAALGFSMLQAGQWALEHASELQCPVLLMHGTKDRITSHEASREFAAKAGANCTLKIWDGFFHDLHFEPERDQVLRFVVDWIQAQVAEPK